ncbi:MAG: hypothetical protein V3R73_06960, partial [Sphingomonadales bacterium]
MRKAKIQKFALAVLVFLIVLLPREAMVSEISFLQTPLPMMVHDSPIIVIARLSQPEAEMRNADTTTTDTEGKPVSFEFRAGVWHFTVLEVLKDEHDAKPSGEIEVVSTVLSKNYLSSRQYYNTGQAMRMSFNSNMTDYVKGPEELEGRDTVLFLYLPMDPKYYTGEPYFEAFGRA